MTFHNRRRRRHHHDHHDHRRHRHRHRHHHHRHHHHLANMQFCHLLTRSGLTGPQVSLTVSPGIFRLSVFSFFCIPDNLLDSVLLTCCNLFFFHIPISCPQLGLYLVLCSYDRVSLK